jgi:drug/metabolite transporter (DMT)-like permease
VFGPGRLLPFVLLIAAAVIYGGLFSLNKIAAEGGLPPIAYAFWQSALAGLILLGVSVLRGTPPGSGWPHLRAYLVIGALAIGLPISLLTYVAPNLPAALVTLVLALAPPATYLFGLLVRIERFRVLGMLGVVAGFVGVVLIVGPTEALPSGEMAGWFLLSLLAPLMFAGSNIAAAVLRPPALTSTAMASGVLLGSAGILLVAMAATGQTYWFADFPTAGDWAVIGAVAVNCAFVVMFLEIIRLAGPVFFAQFNYLAVVAGIGWGWAVFGETLPGIVWLAFLIMVVGVLLTSIKPRPTSPAQR